MTNKQAAKLDTAATGKTTHLTTTEEDPDIPAGCVVREAWDSNPTWRGQTALTLIYSTEDGDEEYNGWGQLSGGEDWHAMDPADVRAEQETMRPDMLLAAIAAFYEWHPT